MSMKTHIVEGIFRGRPHVPLSVDGVWDKQVYCMTFGVIKRWSKKKKKSVQSG